MVLAIHIADTSYEVMSDFKNPKIYVLDTIKAYIVMEI